MLASQLSLLVCCQKRICRPYQLGKEVVCDGNCTGAVAFYILQMMLERPAHKHIQSVCFLAP
jgi:hypothetical protein